jgi:hypothetical protein
MISGTLIRIKCTFKAGNTIITKRSLLLYKMRKELMIYLRYIDSGSR